ncbi:MAG: hypothetical protein M3024_02625 [Candidatus Dormibacteraeota bacterium]|nr:hypothetical protein [Candidatus Dormibacteraeota bacterium]
MSSSQFSVDGYLIWNGQRWAPVSHMNEVASWPAVIAVAILPALALSAILTMPTWLPQAITAFNQLFAR